MEDVSNTIIINLNISHEMSGILCVYVSTSDKFTSSIHGNHKLGNASLRRLNREDEDLHNVVQTAYLTTLCLITICINFVSEAISLVHTFGKIS